MNTTIRNYETLYIVDSTLTDEQTDAIISKYSTLVTEQGGEVQAAGRWDRRRLAYEIKGRREGLYILMYFSGEPTVEKELDRVFRISEDVIRHIILRVEPERVDISRIEKPAPSPEQLAPERAAAVEAPAAVDRSSSGRSCRSCRGPRSRRNCRPGGSAGDSGRGDSGSRRKPQPRKPAVEETPAAEEAPAPKKPRRSKRLRHPKRSRQLKKPRPRKPQRSKRPRHPRRSRRPSKPRPRKSGSRGGSRRGSPSGRGDPGIRGGAGGGEDSDRGTCKQIAARGGDGSLGSHYHNHWRHVIC